MAVKLSPIWVGEQFFDASGKPLSGGQIFQYQAGTTTLQATFTDSTGTVQNANPIVLDSTGRYSAQIWFTVGLTYKLVLQTSGGTTLLTEDNLSGINDTSSGVTSEWLPQSTPTFVSGTSFTVTGNQTTTFQVGMRVKAQINSGFIYGTIATSVFTSLTTITLNNDSGSLDATLSAVSVGLLGETNPSVPAIIPYNTVAFRAHRSTNQSSGTTIIWDTVDEQSGGTNYSNSTGVFTAPFAGFYIFASSAIFSNTSGGTVTEGIVIQKNSTQISLSMTTVATATSAYVSCSVIVKLAVNDTVNVISNVTMSGTNTLTPIQSNNQFSGSLLQRTA